MKKTIKKKASWKYPSLWLLTLVLLLLLGWLWEKVIKDLPNINEIYNPPKLSTKVYDREGELLYQFFEDENRSWVKLEKIPQDLLAATLAIEDKEFYQHHGFSLRGIVKAGIFNLNKREGQRLRGGSTITQQLVKNVFFSNEKSWDRKFKEALMSLLLEKKLSKDEILERYFNQVPYGGNVYGVGEASYRYFGKKVEELNLSEAAFLAGLPAAPGSYSPFSKRGFELAKARQEHVLNEMVSMGAIEAKKAEETKKVAINILEDKKDIEAPHFVFYVKSYLEKLGFTDVGRRGLLVKTSLDLKTQKEVEKIVLEETNKASRLRISNGAAMVVETKSGDILAMVGSKNYFAKDIDGKFDVASQGLRQPGSSIKPINYLLAFQNGYEPWDPIEDSPVSYQIPGQKTYTPRNYTGKFLGRVSLRTALASSLNIPSVKLLKENGVNNMISLGEKMGITSWEDRSRYGLSLALGGGEVKMTDMVQAYSVFANLGEKVEVNPILEVRNYLGETIYQKRENRVRVAGERESFLINSILSDDQARAPVFGSNSLLKIKNKTVAVKTGTTNNLKDNWCIGWTPSYLVAAWVGNNDNSPMSWVASGISGATPIWNRIMRSMIDSKDNEEWKAPEGMSLKSVCGKKEWLREDEEKGVRCFSANLSPSPSQ